MAALRVVGLMERMVALRPSETTMLFPFLGDDADVWLVEDPA